MINEKYSVDMGKTNLELICHELEQGKTSGEFLQTKGETTYGYFKLNSNYVPPVECQEKELPSYSDPPLQKECLPVQEAPKTTKSKPMKNTVKELDGHFPPLLSHRFMQQTYLPKRKISWRDPILGCSPFPNPLNRPKEDPFKDPEIVKQLTHMTETCGFQGGLGMIAEQLLEANERLNAPQPSSSISSSQPESSSKNEVLKETNPKKKPTKINLDIDSDDDDVCVPNASTKSNEVAEKLNSVEIKERKPLSPKVKEALAKMPKDIYLSKTEGTDGEPQTMFKILECLGNPIYRKVILVKNPMSEFVKRINSSNLSLSSFTLCCVIEIWKTEPRTQQEILNENIGKVLLDRVSSCNSNEMLDGAVLHNSLNLTLTISRRLLDDGISITEAEYGNLMRTLLKFVKEDSKIDVGFFAIGFFNFIENNEEFYTNFEMPKEKLTLLFSMMKSAKKMEDKIRFLQFFTKAIDYCPDQLTVLLKLGILDVLASHLDEDEEIAYLFIRCVYLAVERTKNGAKIVFDAGFVDKILPVHQFQRQLHPRGRNNCDREDGIYISRYSKTHSRNSVVVQANDQKCQ
ncbi:hypothetical protein M3Y97_00925400 [Aphelenchoides bicaudatus]|nr:hypothetical protein M3Y97_00925400 [Aphelenchoides bicaudatus]